MRQIGGTRLMNWLAALGAVFFICFAQCSAQVASTSGAKPDWGDLMGTELFGTNCSSLENEGEKKELLCKGVEGHSLIVKGEPLTLRGQNQKPEIFLVSPGGRRFQIQYWDTTDTKFQSLFGVVNWVVVRTPRKTIALILKAQVEPSYDDRGVTDIVVRVGPGSVCVIGSVPASSTQTADSISLASTPRRRRCINVKELRTKD
jgi:hypothetical protein